MHVVEKYKEKDGNAYSVLVVRIVSPDQVLTGGSGSIHQALIAENVAESIGLYFYRFAKLKNPQAFSKIGEVSRKGGVIERKNRGWLAPKSYGDSYLKPSTNGEPKMVYSDVLAATEVNPMYFVFYEFDIENSFPKIDEIAAFSKHIKHFGRTTRNREQANTFDKLGSNLIWHDGAFSEVLELKLPSGVHYSDATLLPKVPESNCLPAWQA